MDSRNSKWLIPSVWFCALLIAARWFLMLTFEAVRWLGWFAVFMAAICAVLAISNFIDYRRNQTVYFLERRQNALAHTALGAQIEAGRGVSPEVTKIIINEWRRVWMMKSGIVDSGPHSVLYGAPDVTDSFLLFFLESCTDKVVMPKRLLVEGRKNRFDPWGAVDEYTMYDKLIALLSKQGKVQRWSQFDGYEWVEPWTPDLAAVDFGIELSKVEEKSDKKGE
jgi:hypothetical protein